MKVVITSTLTMLNINQCGGRLALRMGQSYLSRRAGFSTASMTESTLHLANGILSSKRDCLAKSITLIESTNKVHRMQAKFLLEHLAQHGTVGSKDGKPTLRLGIAGPPGKVTCKILGKNS